jgi:hypothetical protein
MVEVAHISAVDTLYTDIAPPAAFMQLLAQSDVSCEIATP